MSPNWKRFLNWFEHYTMTLNNSPTHEACTTVKQTIHSINNNNVNNEPAMGEQRQLTVQKLIHRRHINNAADQTYICERF